MPTEYHMNRIKVLTENESYIQSVSKIVLSLSWDKLYVEFYKYYSTEIAIVVSKCYYTSSCNYLDIFKEVYKTLPSCKGIILPLGGKDYAFVDLSFEQATDIYDKFKGLAQSVKYARRTKRVIEGAVVSDIIGMLSKLRRSPYYAICYTVDGLKEIGISDYDLSIVNNLPCHGDTLLINIAKRTFVLYSYKRIADIFATLCKCYMRHFFTEMFLQLKTDSLYLPKKYFSTMAKKDFYSHTKILFDCYKTFVTDYEEKRVWHDVELLCDRRLLECAVSDSPTDIPCLCTTRSVNELERLWTWLKESRQIDEAVTKSAFIHYFRREEGETPTHKLLWIGSSKDVLFAVIELLHPKTVRSTEKKRNGVVRETVKTNINWNEISQIIESPNIKVNRLEYRSAHRRRDAEVVRNRYEDMVKFLSKLLGED